MRAQNIVLKSKTPMSGGPPSSPIKASSPIRISKEAFTRRAEVKGALAVRTKGGYDKGCTGFQAAAKEAGGMIRMQCLAEKEPGLNRSPQYQMLMWALLQVYGEDTTQPHCSGAVMHTGVPLRIPSMAQKVQRPLLLPPRPASTATRGSNATGGLVPRQRGGGRARQQPQEQGTGRNIPHG